MRIKRVLCFQSAAVRSELRADGVLRHESVEVGFAKGYLLFAGSELQGLRVSDLFCNGYFQGPCIAVRWISMNFSPLVLFLVLRLKKKGHFELKYLSSRILLSHIGILLS